MSGFSKRLKIRIVTMVIVAMCVLNLSPMTVSAAEGIPFADAAMNVNGKSYEAIQYTGEKAFVLELSFEGFAGELSNTYFNVFFDQAGFGSITTTGSAVSWGVNANRSGDFYRIDNWNVSNAGMYEITLREGESKLSMAFVPVSAQTKLSMSWHCSAGEDTLHVTLRPGDAFSTDYSVLRDFVRASAGGGLGTAGEFMAFANSFQAFGDYEGNIAAAEAQLGGNGQFGVTDACEDKGYTATYIGRLLGDDWSRIVKQTTGALVLGTDEAGSPIYVTRDQGGEWFAWNDRMQPRKIAASGDLTHVFHVGGLISGAGSKAIDFDGAFAALSELAAALRGNAQTLRLEQGTDGGLAVSGPEESALYAGSVSDIRIEDNAVTITCKAGRNNIVTIPASALENDLYRIYIEGENGAEDYSLIVNVSGLEGRGSLRLSNPFIWIDGTQIDPGYAAYAGRLLFNFGDYAGELGLEKTHAGVILAPHASVTVYSTHNGSVIADRVTVLSGELHKNTFRWIPDPEPTPSPTATSTPSPTPTEEMTPTPTATPTPSPTPMTIPSATPVPTATATPTPENTATPTPTEPESTATPVPTEPESTATPTPTEPESTATPTPTEPENTVTPVPTEPENTVTPVPTEPESTATPVPTATATPTPENTATPTPIEPENTVTPIPTEPESTATPVPTATATPTPENTVTPTPTEPESTATPTPTEPESTATPVPTEPENTVTPTPTEPESTVTPIPTATPTPYYTIPTATPTAPPATATPVPTAPLNTPTPTPTIWIPRVDPSVTPVPTDSATATPDPFDPEDTAAPTPDQTEETADPTPDVPVPTPEIIEIDIEEEPPLGTPEDLNDPAEPKEEITVFDPEELLELLDDVPLGIPVVDPEGNPEELEIEDETPEGLPQTGLAGTGFFVAIGMAMMSFGAALGIGGRKKKDKEK